MLLDLHVHTKYSGDANIEPKELIKVAMARGLDGIAITDHNTTRGWKKIPERKGLTIIKGMERTTDHGSVIGLFLNEKIKEQGLWEVIDEIRSQDGIIMIPHPCDYLRRDTIDIKAIDIDLLKTGIDAVETFNSRCILGRFNKKAERLAEDLCKHKVGGSDAHTLGEVGNARTLFEGDSPDIIHAQLKERNPVNTIVFGRLSSRFVHVTSFLNKLRSRVSARKK